MVPPLVATCLLSAAVGQQVVTVDRDDVEITGDCRVIVASDPIADDEGDGVVRITGDGITVEFEPGSRLSGAAAQVEPDAFTGTGIVVTGRNVTLRGARVGGYKVGIMASDAGWLIVEDCDVSGNFRQRLRSTATAEDTGDWLWPHDNDENQWAANYGAGLYVEDSDGVIVRRVRCRRGQNGIVLDNVNDGRIYDNDCSFLSGWGLAMWRSSRNVISRNAFDFCIRGYSHGVYNRGQDSAGILMFEQCSGNWILENSATHGGDGLFGFAGREALGQASPRSDETWYARRGNNDNVIAGNDFSYAAAHGIEMTFSFGNVIRGNRLVGNAICGVWGGYSCETQILDNRIAGNGDMGYGLERGGVNIEHGARNAIVGNDLVDNACGVHLWWDEDRQLMATPWARVNGGLSEQNVISFNEFEGNTIDVQLRRSDDTTLEGVRDSGLEADDRSRRTLRRMQPGQPFGWGEPEPRAAIGDTRPAGARKHLRGRERILMTEWGPYDWREPLLHLAERGAARHAYRLLGGASGVAGDGVRLEGEVKLERDGDLIVLTPRVRGTLVPYEIAVGAADATARARGTLAALDWLVRVFAYDTDPREDVEAWRREAHRGGVATTLGRLDLRYGTGGPADIGVEAFTGSETTADRFGTIATTRVTIPAGRWRLDTLSDDGIRVWLGGELVIDDWTWHAPKRHVYEMTVEEPTAYEIRVEHFELDGYAVLSVTLE